jgi:arsenite methyltransferase
MPTVEDTVKQHYRKIALSTGTQECCASNSETSDYSTEDLTGIPASAYLGEGSGNPVRHAHLKPGERVVDLGSGAGIDVFLAANAVGEDGYVVGIDMTPEMLERARDNARIGGYVNVEFHLANIEKLPVSDGSVDVVISNCVINLSSNKKAVFDEAFRILKPAGRLAISDVITDVRIPEELKNEGLYCICVGGAMERSEYLKTIRDAGFSAISIVSERPSNVKMPAGVEARPRAITLLAEKAP